MTDKAFSLVIPDYSAAFEGLKKIAREHEFEFADEYAMADVEGTPRPLGGIDRKSSTHWRLVCSHEVLAEH